MTELALPPGFMVIHSNQPELLRQLMVNWMKAHPLKPLENEIMLVQSNGIAQWLKHALAKDESVSLTTGCGIAAALRFMMPSSFIWQAYRAVLGQENVPESSPFDKPQLIWRLMRLLPQLVQKKGYEPLMRFLSQDNDLRKRYQLAERIADLFDQYQVYRADWLATWAQNESNFIVNYQGNATGLSDEYIWQPMLWRALQADVGIASNTSRAVVHQHFLDTAKKLKLSPAGLPRRVIVFGLSSLPKQSLEVLQALSKWSQVLLCVNNPCEHYWANIQTEKDFYKRLHGRHVNKPGVPDILKEEDYHLHTHPLLASWGKQGRDYIALLDLIDNPDNYRQLFTNIGQRIDLFESHGEDCLLNQLQDDIRELRPTFESISKWNAINPEQDQSIRFHITHSSQREVEVLHDQLLDAFNTDPSLKPREIMVMVPDINQYAPHIQAVFGQINPTDNRYIPFSISDLGKRQQSTLMFALEFLLNLPESRLTVSEILDLLNVPAVRNRFGIEEADLVLLHQWINQANIRWGLNSQHREALGITYKDYEQNTWFFGLKRMLLGYAVGTDSTGRHENDWHEIEPFGDFSGLDAALIGPLANLLTQIESLLTTLNEPASPADWVVRLQKLLLDFFKPTETEDSYLLLQLQASLEQWLVACEQAALTDLLTLSVMRDFWLSQIDQNGLSQRFFAGNLTFSTLMPMRAIPFRRIYLLGMNDGEYPRVPTLLDFDLMSKDYRPGDRSRREDDRYLFLEAVLSAREHLHISWVGRNINDNTEHPPSVLVSQLRDHIAMCWSLEESPEEKSLLKALTIEHRLQPFNNDYVSDEQQHASLFTYAHEWHTTLTDKVTANASNEGLPAPVFDSPLSLEKLIGFMNDPVKTFFRERLEVFYEFDDLTSEDQETFKVNALNQWHIQNELIKVRLDAKRQGQQESLAVERQLKRIHRQGILPAGARNELLQTEFIAPLDALFKDYEQACQTWPIAIKDEVIAFDHCVNGQVIKIQDQLNNLFVNANNERCRIEINSSNLIEKNKYRRDKLIPAWIKHIAGHLNDQTLTTILISKNGRVVLSPLDPKQAKQYLLTLIEAYVQGLCKPLPIAPKTSLAWLMNKGEQFCGPLDQYTGAALTNTQKIYEGEMYSIGEVVNNPYLQRIYPTFEALWSQGEFTCWSQRLLSPLLDHIGEQVNKRKGNGA